MLCILFVLKLFSECCYFMYLVLRINIFYNIERMLYRKSFLVEIETAFTQLTLSLYSADTPTTSDCLGMEYLSSVA